MSPARKKKTNQTSKKPYLILALSLLVLFVWLEGVLGTPYQASLSQTSSSNVQDLSGIGTVPVTNNPISKSAWSVDASAEPHGQVWLSSNVSASAPAKVDNKNFLDESTGSTAVPEPPSMLLFASALIGLASIGRKRFLKK